MILLLEGCLDSTWLIQEVETLALTEEDGAEDPGESTENAFVAGLPEDAQQKVPRVRFSSAAFQSDLHPQVSAMRDLHQDRIKLEQQFEEERIALLHKYQSLEEPLNESRKGILVRKWSDGSVN